MFRASPRTIAVFAAAAVLSATVALAIEPAPTATASSLLGADVKGANWTVNDPVKSDGFARIFSFTTPYGDFNVNGQRRMVQRLQELRAITALEAMSKTEAFGKALANAGMAPIRFGRDLIVDPVETTGNVVTGIGKMFHAVTASVSGEGVHRDSWVESAAGVTAAERELAFQLHVDPYTDFTPLRNALNDVARAMAGGGLTVTAAFMASPGGAGVVVGATSSAADFASSIASKTALEIADLTRAKLAGMGVDKDTTEAFIKNHEYSPQDQYDIAEALEKLGAQNASAFIASATGADTADVAKFNVYRAQLLAADSDRVGKLTAFFAAGDVAVNMNAKNHIVAMFPFDLVAWTDTVSASVTKLTADVKAQYPKTQRFLATTGNVSEQAQAELHKLGWSLIKL